MEQKFLRKKKQSKLFLHSLSSFAIRFVQTSNKKSHTMNHVYCDDDYHAELN